MRVLRQKVFSLLTERIREEYLIKPGDFDKFPKIVQNYYLQGINKDFYDLINLQGCHGLNPFPTPILDKNLIKMDIFLYLQKIKIMLT